MVEEKSKAHPRGFDVETLKSMDIKVWSYLEEYEKEKEEIHKAIEEVLNSGMLILGDKVKKFEEEFANYCNVKYGIGVGNCTDALFLSLKALDIGDGDEVITVANTAVPTVAAIVASGARPKFVDINLETHLMDTSKIEKVITNRTKCILPVHLYGQCVDMDSVKKIAEKYNLKIIEDCAQAHGATYNEKKSGSMSDLAAFSFYPTKVLGGYGDGGMVVTNNESLAKRVKRLRMYGMEGKYSSKENGYNSRLDELHASILINKLKKLDNYISKRQKIAKKYDIMLRDVNLELPKTTLSNKHVYYVYNCRYKKRNELINNLKNRGVFLNVSYEWPIHTMEGYKCLGYKEGDLPNTEKACKENISLPMYSELDVKKQEKFIDILKEEIDKL